MPAYPRAELEEMVQPRIVLVTAHRRENWGQGLANIAGSVLHLATKYPQTQFVVPMHPNPIARAPMVSVLSDFDNVFLVEPRDYRSFARLMAASRVILTDSGGIQEEAPALGTPVIVARESTERQEGVESGTLVLVGTNVDKITAEVSLLLDDETEHARRVARPNPYGDGHASSRIVAALEHIFHDGPAQIGYEGTELRSAVGRRLGLAESALAGPR